MQRFIRTVSEMEETVLVPSRLLDLTVGDSEDDLEGERGSIIKTTLANTDLYQLFNTISQMKVELLWSQEHMTNFQELQENFVPSQRFRRGRCLSSASIQSVQSISASSDSESDVVIENYSQFDTEDAANATALSFKRHLREVYRNILKMTYAAEYLTQRYQTGVDRKI